MKFVKSEDMQGKLEIREVAQDFLGKVTYAESVVEHHSADGYGGELLLVYVPGRKVAEPQAKAILAAKLKAIGSELIAELPDVSLPVIEQVVETDKAVVDDVPIEQPEPVADQAILAESTLPAETKPDKPARGKRKANESATSTGPVSDQQ